MTPQPPKWAERLVTWSVGDDDRDAALGDLAEEFAERATRDGARAARRWYWRQARASAVNGLRNRRRHSIAQLIAAGSFRDLRDAARSLRSSPAFTGVVLIVLTLGVGASTAIFSVVDAVVLRDLPVGRSDQLMVVGQLRQPSRFVGLAPQDFGDFRARQDVFEDLAATSGGGAMSFSGDPTDSIRATRATAHLFSVLQVTPHLGSTFSPANEIDGADRVAVLSDGFWRRRFGADPTVIGRTIATDKGEWQVIGVMAPGFSYPITRSVDMWIPLTSPPAERVRSATGYHADRIFDVVGRLKPGASPAQAQARLVSIAGAIAPQFPDWFRSWSPMVKPLRETIIGADVQSWMLMLLAAVTFVLLIACVNVASLMLARATARSREMGVRAALGASRPQLVRGVLTESLLLSALGTSCGVAAAYGAIDVIRTLLPQNLPRSADIAVNWRVLFAAAATSIVTGLICGLLPAIQATRPNLARSLREGGRTASASRSRQRLRAILVAAEVGLAIILLVGAGLFMSSFVKLSSVDLGLDYRRVLTVGIARSGRLTTPAMRAAEAARVSALVNDALPVIRSLPGVESAAALSGTRPLEGGSDRVNVVVPGHEDEFKSVEDAADLYRVTPSYTSVLSVPLIRGRVFQASEEIGDPPVVLLNEAAAVRYFPERDPIGQTIRIAGDRTVVGVVHNLRAGGPETDVRPEAYLPFEHGENPNAYLVIKTKDDPAAAITAVKSAIRSVAPDLPVTDVRTLEDFLGKMVAPRKFNMLLIGLFGALALAIASVGIYGVMAFVVEQRTAEIGLRMALGAQRREVIGIILQRALAIMTSGVAAGLLVAWPLSQTVRAFLFHVEPHEFVVYAGAAFVLLSAGLFAAFGPARRASRVDPVIALRAE